MTVTFTAKQFAEAVLKYADSDNVNPKDGEACRYTDRNNPSRHCLIGQVLLDLGVEQSHLDEGEGEPANWVMCDPSDRWEPMADYETCEFASSLQREADQGSDNDDVLPWRVAIGRYRTELEAMAND
jgi:hypothetical protein